MSHNVGCECPSPEDVRPGSLADPAERDAAAPGRQTGQPAELDHGRHVHESGGSDRLGSGHDFEEIELASFTEIALTLLHWQDLTAEDAKHPANYRYFQLSPKENE